MSDDYTPEQLEELAADLAQLQEQLTALLAVNSDAEAVVDLDQPIGRVSRIDAIQQQKMAQANKSRNRIRLRQVVAALAALRSDVYGLCKSCEEAIDFKRLKARPESAFCIDCQHEFESARNKR